MCTDAWAYSGLSWWLGGKESARPWRRRGFDPWMGKIPWRRKERPTPPLQRSCLGNLTGRGAFWATVRGVVTQDDKCAYAMSTTDTKFTNNKDASLLPHQTHTNTHNVRNPDVHETHIHNTYNVHKFTAQTHKETDRQSVHTRNNVLRMILFLAVKSIWYHTDLLNPALLIHLSPGPPSMPQHYVLAKLLTLQCRCLTRETAGLTVVNNPTYNMDKQNPCLAPPMGVQWSFSISKARAVQLWSFIIIHSEDKGNFF